MDSFSDDYQLEQELTKVGIELLRPPKPVNEIISLLDKLEHLLSKVEQEPPISMRAAIFPAIYALIAYRLLRHSNLDVKVSVASCINEITRISPRDPPYSCELMKEIFQLTIRALKRLPSLSSHCYHKATRILEILATVRSCLMMLDLECDALVIKMFQQFLNTIRPDHPSFVFSYMEEIMTMIIEESEEVSVELLNPLLFSVKKENQSVSPLSWKLGERVLNNCAATLKPYLTELLKSTSLVLDDYSEIVTSICQDQTVNDHMVVSEVGAADAVCPQEISPSVDALSDLVSVNDTNPMRNEDSLQNEDSLMLLQMCYQIEDQEDSDSRTDDQPEKQDAREILQPETGPQPEKKDERESLPVLDPEVLNKRDRKPNSLIKPEEGYGIYWITGKSIILEMPRRRKNQGKKVDSETYNVVKEDKITSDFEVIQESLARKVEDKKTNKCVTGESGDQELVSPFVIKSLNRDDSSPNESFKTKHKRKQASRKEEGSGMPRDIEEYGEEFVGLRIKVWWPLDKMYYEGIISYFDPLEKRHKVLYDDGDEEILDLSVERFQLLGNTLPEQEQPANHPSTAGLSIRFWKKKAKTRSKSSVKQERSAPSSKW